MSAAPALWTRHRGIALGIAKEYRLPGADRDDVRQEALIALWEAARTHQPELSSFPTFARTVIHRHLTDCLRAATRGRALNLTNAVRDHDQPRQLSLEDEAEQRDTVRRLVHAIDQLPARQRAVVIGSCLEGRFYSEIGERKAVDNLLYKARRTLRQAA